MTDETERGDRRTPPAVADHTEHGATADGDGSIATDRIRTDGGEERRVAPAATGTAHADDRSKIAQLHEMATEIVACRDEERLFDLAVETAKGVLAFDTSAILIHEEREDGDWLVQRAGTSAYPIDYETEFRPTRGLAGETFQTGESFRVDDADEHDVARPASDRFRSAISVPIGDVGVFQAISTEVGGFDETDHELAEILASHVAETLQRIRVENRLRERRETVTRLHEGTLGLTGADTEDELFERAVDAAEGILEMDVCYLGIVEDGEFVPKGRPSWPIREDIGSLPLDYGLMGETHDTGDSFLIADATADDRTHSTTGDFRAVISVPVGDFGVFQAISTTPDTYDETDLELVELLSAHVAETLARLRAESEVVEERDRLSALFDNVPDPAVRYEFVDGQPIVRDVNDAFEDVFGYDHEEILGESVDDYILPPGYEDEGRDLNRALMAGEPVQHTSKRQTTDGIRDVKIDVVPLQRGEHSPEGFSIYTDITDQKRRERELRDQNERLDRFASVVSHDLRNPLSVAAGYLERTRETGDLSLLDEVERSHQRTFDIIDDVLTLARTGGEVTETERVELSAVASDAWANVDTDDARLDIPAADSVRADRGRLRQLFENLFRNAVEHGSTSRVESGASEDAVEHGSTSRSEATTAADDQVLTVTVADTPDGFAVSDDGAGFDEAVDRENVFDFGYTASQDGTGLGLSIVAEIADGHGWTVDADTSESGGARFVFRTDGATNSP
ncbi:GAF domain-containing protein [Halovivax cerinus]|uniref:histidine kinase n=1 Tax=Halovivax cerinus TaxID=1487865 RepID=A0ABD5NS05_9EURY|nr:GAF domain-containing protein [Halovivax cerinus]